MNILEHIISSIKESQLDPNPFPHLFIDSFFEKKYYQELIEALPNKNKYVPLNKTGSVSENYPPERFIFDISPEILPELKEDQFNVFNNLVKAFFSIEFFNAITSKFKNTIDHRIANFSQEEKNMFGHNNFNCHKRSLN